MSGDSPAPAMHVNIILKRAHLQENLELGSVRIQAIDERKGIKKERLELTL